MQGQQGFTREKRWVTWHPSREEVTVLNVDGSWVRNPGHGDYGGLLRRADGEWIVGFAGSVGGSDSLQAELMALFHGLCLAQEEAISRLKCYSESMLALGLVQDDGGELHRYVALIRNIRNLLAQD